MAVYFDVGAHLGETTWWIARDNPDITVYAFEPNIQIIQQRFNTLSNFIVIPVAVGWEDEMITFYPNRYTMAASTLPIDPEGQKKWKDGHLLEQRAPIMVPQLMLCTFMGMADIDHVDYLKIDTQGRDLDVVKGLDDRISDVDRICLEVAVTDFELYKTSDKKTEVLAYMKSVGFTLKETHSQSYGQEENLIFER